MIIGSLLDKRDNYKNQYFYGLGQGIGHIFSYLSVESRKKLFDKAKQDFQFAKGQPPMSALA